MSAPAACLPAFLAGGMAGVTVSGATVRAGGRGTLTTDGTGPTKAGGREGERVRHYCKVRWLPP